VIALVLLMLGASVAVATHPEILQNLAITPCSRYILVSAHASHPQQDNPGGVVGKIGYDFSYRPWGTVVRVRVLPNAADVQEVVFVLNKTGLMQYFKLFEGWKPKDIALIVYVNDRSLGFEFAYLYPDGHVKGYSNRNVKIVGNEIHVKTHGWRREPCDLNIRLTPAIEFYNGIAPVNWLALPGADAKLKCASCMVGAPKSSTITDIPNARLWWVSIYHVSPWHPQVNEPVSVQYSISLDRPADTAFHVKVSLAVDKKTNVVKTVEVVIPKGVKTYKGSITTSFKIPGIYMLYLKAEAYGKTIWSRAYGVEVWVNESSSTTSTSALPALPPPIPTPSPTQTTTTQPQAPTPPSPQTPKAPSTPSILDKIASWLNSIADWFRSLFKW